MENFRFILISIIVLVLLAFAGYWSFSTIESGSDHRDNQKLQDLTEENENLKDQISDREDEIISLQSKIEKLGQDIQGQEKLTETEVKSPETIVITSKYQSLINDLQQLVNGNVYLKKGSKGVQVGVVQKFLNVYNGTANKIDNDFGSNMETAIKKFQKDQGLTSDGEIGSNTFRKMIDWLKKQ